MTIRMALLGRTEGPSSSARLICSPMPSEVNKTTRFQGGCQKTVGLVCKALVQRNRCAEDVAREVRCFAEFNGTVEMCSDIQEKKKKGKGYKGRLGELSLLSPVRKAAHLCWCW